MAKKKTQPITWTNERRKLSDLIPWEKNPRTIKNAQAERLVDSVETFGQVETLAIDPDNGVLNGHQRLSVLAGQYGMDYEVDVRVASRELTERERQQLTVYLHKGAAGEFDMGALLDWDINDDLINWGFSAEELNIDFDDEPTTAGTDTEPQVSKADELKLQWGTELGQMWALGEHKIICGDCTDAATVARVMGGEKADMMFTDPPYGVDYSGGIQFHKDGTVETNNRERLAGDADPMLYSRFLPVVLPHVDGPCYMWFADRAGKPVYDAVLDNKCEIHALLIWHKINATYAAMNAQYKQRHEPCLYFKPKKSTLRWCGPTNECTIWEIKRDGQNEFHPTQKPIELAERAMGNHDADLVVDFFLGSGSTLIAAQNKKRRCYGTELDAGYVAVILDRFHRHTGIQPELID